VHNKQPKKRKGAIMRKKSYQRWLFLAALAVMPCGAATIHVEIFPGTAAPPATLGGYVMQAFPTEMRGL
jgi:hypothetical protein